MFCRRWETRIWFDVTEFQNRWKRWENKQKKWKVKMKMKLKAAAAAMASDHSTIINNKSHNACVCVCVYVKINLDHFQNENFLSCKSFCMYGWCERTQNANMYIRWKRADYYIFSLWSCGRQRKNVLWNYTGLADPLNVTHLKSEIGKKMEKCGPL